MVRVCFEDREDREDRRSIRSGSRTAGSSRFAREDAVSVLSESRSVRSSRSTRSTKSNRSKDSQKSRKVVLEKALHDVSAEFTCPLSRELMIDPVVAEDGVFYERYDITNYIRSKSGSSLRSPVTGQPMGSSLKSASSMRQTIEKLVRSGAISIEKLIRWQEKLENEDSQAAEMVAVMEEKAFAGSANAMYNLGVWHQFGRFGIEKDTSKAFRWYKKSADLDDPCGMANAGCCLIWGLGTEANKVYGMHLLSTAANTESDFAAKILGDIFCDGMLEMPKDIKKSIYWYQKALDSNTKYRQLTPMERENITKKILKMSKLQAKLVPKKELNHVHTNDDASVGSKSVGSHFLSFFGISSNATKSSKSSTSARASRSYHKGHRNEF